jgi:mannose/fructose/N-acetylgalactosamine-specific phosphotransferase system component IIB
MLDFTEIQNLRRAAQQEKQAQSVQDKNLSAITGGSQDMVAAFKEESTQPREVTVLNDNLADKQDIDKLINHLKEVQLASLMSGHNQNNAQPAQILSDSALYVGDSIEQLGKKIMDKLDSDTSGSDNSVLLQQLKSALDEFNSARQGDNSEVTKALQKVSKAVDGIDVQPVVNVQPPKVTVKAPIVDLQPLQDTFEKYLSSDSDESTVDLNCFRAQDLTNDGNLQYIGFVHPNGNWYIIENHTKQNKLRYVFGKQDYQKAFADAASYEYATLDEAVHALSA